MVMMAEARFDNLGKIPEGAGVMTTRRLDVIHVEMKSIAARSAAGRTHESHDGTTVVDGFAQRTD